MTTEPVAPPEPPPSAARIFRTPASGLSSAEVQERVARGAVTGIAEGTGRSVGQIVRANVATRFNAILGACLAVVIAAGSLRDALFGIVLVLNSLIGIAQELRAKRTLDRLAVLSAPRAHVVRDGEECEIAVEDVVLDDLVLLTLGDQVPADGEVVLADGLELDESLLTGESEPVDKAPGDEVMSGSFVVAGAGRFQASRVGAESYARKLAAEAKRFTVVGSELRDGINRVLRYVTWAILPTSVLLLVGQFRAVDGWNAALDSGEWREALVGTVAGIVAMVPQGLVLLTSIAFGVAAVTLARRRVLVQELAAVEGLARVDVVCLDKTGTLTDGEIVFDRVEPLMAAVEYEQALGALAAEPSPNATTAALGAELADPGWNRIGSVPFSSARKWSAASFDGHGTWVLGAPEMVLSDRGGDDRARSRADDLARTGARTLVICRTSAPLAGEDLPPDLVAAALVLFVEKVRPDAAATLRYFEEQGVELKVISGDNPRTVAAVAARVGLPGAGEGFDARRLPEDIDELAETMEHESVFGRVSPHQKRSMVHALQRKGHTVAMTGDGVNDALALKDADMGIAMGSGAAATRAVAQLVLLDGRFATLPGVVAEGRRVIANIERVANVFVTKTVWATLLSISVGLLFWPYPFLPRQLTLIDWWTIGIPGFFLALAPNKLRYVPGFIDRVLRFTLPAGAVVAVTAFSVYWLARAQDATTKEAQTAVTIALTALGLWVLGMLARPWTVWRIALFATMAGGFAFALLLPVGRSFFQLALPEGKIFVETAVIVAVGMFALEVGYQAAQRVRIRRRHRA